MKNKMVFIVAILLGLLTAALIFVYLNQMQQSIDNTEYVEIVVANREIPAKTIIASNMVTTKKIPTQYVHAQEVTATKEVVGKIARVDLTQGQSIYRDHLLEQGDGRDGLAFKVPPGKRAMTVAVDEVSGIAGLIKPEDRVDVIATVSVRDEPYTVIALQNIQVLAVGVEMDRRNDAKPIETRTVTLAVNYDEAKQLMAATQRGVIRLMLRSPLDEATGYSPPLRVEELIR